MKRVDIVIGANFGDEGKGLITDYLASDSKYKPTIVVRHNGGAQAGHTVVTPDGKRHVFGHINSGKFAGATTGLSNFFLFNPLVLLEELRELGNKTSPWGMIIDPRVLVTTPYDMIINQAAELNRTYRHGSCGLGINETIQRSSYLVNGEAPYRLCVDDIQDINKVREILKKIATEYAPSRLINVYGVSITPQIEALFSSDRLLDNFVQAFQGTADRPTGGNFQTGTFITTISSVLDQFEHVIFEGAQGLLLDEEHRWFPHVTHSKTGSINALKILKEANYTGEVHIYYVTRWYMTRHGNGPFPTEDPNVQAVLGVEDSTNVPNSWQGTLRYGYLDLDLFDETVNEDLEVAYKFGFQNQIKPHIAVTCLDQGSSTKKYYQSIQNTYRITETPDFLRNLAITASIDVDLVSYGPTRAHVKEYTE